jgi:hypothetical protein
MLGDNMEKVLVNLECGCTYKTFNNCICDNTYCDTHKAIQDKLSFEIYRQEALSEKKRAVTELELKNLRKIFDGEDMTAVNAERAKLRTEIKALEK